jgi:hypothetical protein
VRTEPVGGGPDETDDVIAATIRRHLQGMVDLGLFFKARCRFPEGNCANQHAMGESKGKNQRDRGPFWSRISRLSRATRSVFTPSAIWVSLIAPNPKNKPLRAGGAQ